MVLEVPSDVSVHVLPLGADPGYSMEQKEQSVNDTALLVWDSLSTN